MTSSDLFRILGYLLQALGWLIVARALLSWFPNFQGHPIADIIRQLTDPILIPVQRIVPRIGMIDISPMIATFILFALSSVLIANA